jgi:hypothetical protein
LLGDENVKIFLQPSELTVQQDIWPQPPPEPEKEEWENPPSGDVEQKRDTFFFSSLDPHSGQVVSFSEDPTLCSTEKPLPHFMHIYS